MVLTGLWRYHLKLALDHGDIDDALTDFPVLVHLSASCGRDSRDLTTVFDVLGSNYLKLAFTDADGNELYYEVEDWDATAEEAYIWVKMPSVSASEDTVLHLYFDPDQADNTSYGGLPNSVAAENVWDAAAVLVSHMGDSPDTSHIRDSTSNDNDGAKSGAGSPAVDTGGRIGDAQSFNGAGSYVDMGSPDIIDNLAVDAAHPVTFMAWVHVAEDKRNTIFGKEDQWEISIDPSTEKIYWAGWGVDDGSTDFVSALNTWYRLVLAFPANNKRLYVNGIRRDDFAISTYRPATNSSLLIGRCSVVPARDFHGLVDEARIYSRVPSDAEIRADYESGRDHLVSAGFIEMMETSSFASTRRPTSRRPMIDMGLVEGLVQYLSNKLTGF